MKRKNDTKKLHESVERLYGRDVLAPLVSYHATLLTMKLLKEDAVPSEGIYYILPYPGKWSLFPYRFDQFPEIDHSELWESYCSAMMASAWSKKLNVSPRQFRSQIMELVYSVPRGRITKGKGGYLIFNGNDWKQTGISEQDIRAAFGLPATSKLMFDDHEVQFEEQTTELNSLTGQA